MHVLFQLFLGSNLKVQAENGSGKSCAFLIPIIHKLAQQQRADVKSVEQPEKKHKPDFDCAKAIIIEPSRELAIQVYEQALKLAENTGVTVSICFGEFESISNVDFMWEKGCDILVGTVGRLNQFLKEGIVSSYVRESRFDGHIVFRSVVASSSLWFLTRLIF